jgi:hypothetical protein
MLLEGVLDREWSQTTARLPSDIGQLLRSDLNDLGLVGPNGAARARARKFSTHLILL